MPKLETDYANSIILSNYREQIWLDHENIVNID